MFTMEISQNGKVINMFSPEVVKSSICSKKTLGIIQEMLLGVVEKGTGSAVKSDVIRIAGKTGTAQLASGGVYRTSGHQVSFCGYFPAENPLYSCIVVIRRPRIGYPSGGTMSGGVVKSVAEKIYANHMAFDIRKQPVDSTAVLLPPVKNGDVQAAKKVLKKFRVKTDEEAWTSWILAEAGQEKLKIKDLPVEEGLVPRVTGMGAKDAIYLLESTGLQVTLSGVGKVSAQSIAAGQKIVPGQTVHLTLK